jgi:sec-independent protein translocase protein TatA
MGALSPWHFILIAIVALLLFGPSKLPELGRGFGKMFRDFKDATSGNSSNEDHNQARKEIQSSEVPNNDVTQSQSGPNGQLPK